MNKKGDVPPILLLVSALILIGVAIAFFVTFNKGFESSSGYLSNAIIHAQFNEGYVVKTIEIAGGIAVKEGANKDKLKERILERDFKVKGTEEFFEKIQKGEFSYSNVVGNYFFDMKNITVMYDTNNNFAWRTFDFRIIFNSAGDVIFKDSGFKILN